jgi:hypothetical protein
VTRRSVPERGPQSTARLRRLNRWQAEGMREDLADLYVESTSTASGDEYRGREDFLARLAADVRQPGFSMLVAETAALAGCAFGFPVGRDGSWWQGFRGPLPQNLEQLTASGHVFAVTAIVVHPHERSRGLPAGCRSGCSPTTTPRSASPCWTRTTTPRTAPSGPGAGNRSAWSTGHPARPCSGR